MKDSDTISTGTTGSVSEVSRKWMECPNLDNVKYPGLAYIHILDELIVAEKRDRLHSLIADENSIGYTVFNKEGEKVFLGTLKRQYRKFLLKFYNNYGNEVIEVKKPRSWLFNATVMVSAPPGHFVGSVVQSKPCFKTFFVNNKHGKKILKITSHKKFKYKYEIQSMEGKIGVIMKEWRLKDVRDVNNFGVTFPTNLACGVKATLLGACFLIGFSKYNHHCECCESFTQPENAWENTIL